MSATLDQRFVVVLGVSPPAAAKEPARLEATLLADAVDAAEALAAARIAVLCRPEQATAMQASADLDTTVWSNESPTVTEAATLAAAAGARSVVVVASDAPHLPGLLVGKLFRPLGRCDITISPDPRGIAVAVGLRLPVRDWIGQLDLDRPDVIDTVRQRAPRQALVRTVPGWRRLRESSDFAALGPTVEGADLTRALLRRRSVT